MQAASQLSRSASPPPVVPVLDVVSPVSESVSESSVVEPEVVTVVVLVAVAVVLESESDPASESELAVDVDVALASVSASESDAVDVELALSVLASVVLLTMTQPPAKGARRTSERGRERFRIFMGAGPCGDRGAARARG